MEKDQKPKRVRCSEELKGQDSCQRDAHGAVTRAVLGGEAMKGLSGQVKGPEMYLYAAW